MRKQTILYYFPSKDALLDGVIDACADELTAELERTLGRRRRRLGPGRGRRAQGLPHRRPPARAAGLPPRGVAARPAGVDPARRPARPARRAGARLPRERDGGRRLRPRRSALVLLAAYSMVVGVATEVEVLGALGQEPTLRALVRRRNGLLALLARRARRSALGVEPDAAVVALEREADELVDELRRTSSPVASHSFGYIEIGVNPGMVLSSLTRNPRPSSS